MYDYTAAAARNSMAGCERLPKLVRASNRSRHAHLRNRNWIAWHWLAASRFSSALEHTSPPCDESVDTGERAQSTRDQPHRAHGIKPLDRGADMKIAKEVGLLARGATGARVPPSVHGMHKREKQPMGRGEGRSRGMIGGTERNGRRDESAREWISPIRG